MSQIISKISIKNSSGTYDTRDIGAKGQNVKVGYDASGKVILDVDTQNPTTTKQLTEILQNAENNISNLNKNKAPSSHAWSDTDGVNYGLADGIHYGHIKTGNGLTNNSGEVSVAYGTSANTACQGNDSRLSNARKNPNAVTFSDGATNTIYDGSSAKTVTAATVGAAPAGHTTVNATSSILGHVKTGTGITNSSGTISVSYGSAAGTACQGNDSRLSDSRTPKSHASGGRSYGAGSTSTYGHVKLTDEYSVDTPNASTNGANTGIAASAYALQQAYNTLNSNLIFNSIYKHRNLGTITFSNRNEWISRHINSDGTFNDIYVGDVVTIQDGSYNAKWIVAGLDTEYNKGDTALTTHHISLIPQTYLFTAPMNDTNTTAGGYAGSKMYTTTLVTVANNLKKALGSHLLERRVLLSNSINTSIASGAGAGYTGASNNWDWFSAFCTLLTEVQVYGSRIFSSSPYDIGEGCSQLPLFKFVNPVYHGSSHFWLRAVASSYGFAVVRGNCCADYNYAGYAFGVRPLITIG